jgi:hypothetical protein
MSAAYQQNLKRWLSFKNTSGEAIPSYAVMMLESDTTTDDTTPNYLARLLFTQPAGVDDSDKPLTFALNSASPVTDAEGGNCTFGIDAPVWARIEADSGDSTWDVSDPSLDWVGEEWGPVDGRWDLNIGGSGFIIQGPPDLENGRILVRQASASNGVGTIPGSDCSCCGDCICYPADEEDVIDACGAIPCLLGNYTIAASLPFISDNDLAHDTGCIYESASFGVTICGVSYGTHNWKLTVAAGCCSSTLELVGSIPLSFVSAGPFLALCGNEFLRVEDCDLYADDTLKSVSRQWPSKVCVNPVGSTDCECETEAVEGVCDCETPYPSVMTATLDAPGCPVPLDGLSVVITYVGVVSDTGNWHRWQGDFTFAPSTPDFCDQPFTFYFDIIEVPGVGGCKARMWIEDATDAIVWGDKSSDGIVPVDCPWDGAEFTGTMGTAVPDCLSTAMSPTCIGLMTATVT